MVCGVGLLGLVGMMRFVRERGSLGRRLGLGDEGVRFWMSKVFEGPARGRGF